jgi:hypothetical protein
MLANKLGSVTFGTHVIKTDEFIIAAKVITKNGGSVKQADLEIRAIDDCLSFLRMWPIIQAQRFTKTGRIRKDGSLQDFISRRYDQLIEELHKEREI